MDRRNERRLTLLAAAVVLSSAVALCSASAPAQTSPSVRIVSDTHEQDPKNGPTSRAGLKASIDAGHEWLKKHQEKDGHFSASMFLVHDPRGKPCDGPGKPDQDVFVTALVSTAWSGMGWLPDAARTHEHQCRAMEWLETQVQDDGSLGLPGSRTLVRDTAIGSEVLYWANRYYQARESRLDESKTAQWLLAQRLPSGFWQPGAVVAEGAKSAKATGEQGADWLTTCMTARYLAQVDSSDVGWDSLEGVVQLQQELAPRAAHGGAAYLAAWYVRDTARRTEYCGKQFATLPAKHTRADRVDYYGWYGATQAMQFEHHDRWDAWWRALTTAAVAMQRADGSFAGSWDPIDVRGRDGGRIYATATVLLALEVIWRKQYRDK